MADDTYSRGYRNDPFDRGGTGSAGPATDPLTELARLIGQGDPFAADRNRQADPHAADAHAQSTDWGSDPHQQPQHYDDDPHDAPHDDRYGGAGEQQAYPDNAQGAVDLYAYQNGHAYPHEAEHSAGYGEQAYRQGQPAYLPDDQPYQEPQPAYFGQHGSAPEQGGYEAAQADPHGDYPPPPFFGSDPNTRPDDYYEDAPAPRRGWMVTAAALVGLAVVGTAGAFAYRAVFSGGQPSIITRDVGPSKITPSVTNADNGSSKSSERLAMAGQNERLGPPPEQPIAIPDPPRTVPPPALGQSQNPVPPPALAPAMPAAPPVAPSQATGPSDAGPAPRKVPTVRIKPDQPTDALAARPVTPPRTIAPSPAQPRVAAQAPAPPAPSANAPLSLAPQAIPDAPRPSPAPAPKHTTALAPSAPAADQGGGGGAGYYVQVSAQKSEEEAKSSFRGIQARHASLLGGHHPVFRRKDLGSKGVFYGAQVGPFSREAASKLCKDLEAAGQSCMIQRN
jgi:hypothetical protein